MVNIIKINRRTILKLILLFSMQLKLFSAPLFLKKDKLKIIFGSCSNQNRKMSHWRQILSYKPDALFLLGDNVYGDFYNAEAQNLKLAYNKLDHNESFKTLKNNVPILSVWDDHDYGQNDAGKNWTYKEISKQIFLDFFNVPLNDMRRHREGIYTSKLIKVSSKIIKVIALDTRYFRDDFKFNNDSNIKKKYINNIDPSKSILGAKQWDWFIDQINESYDFLIVLSSFQILSTAHGWEKWGNFPLERKKIINYLSSLSKPVLILSGDRHFGGIYDSGYNNFIEVTSSSFNQNVFNYNELDQLRVSRLINENNFGVLEIDDTRIKVKIVSGNIEKSTEYANAILYFT